VNNVINLVYIDDSIDTGISRYIRTTYKNANFAINYRERQFMDTDEYETLLKDDVVISAHIILVDSKLFEDVSATHGKYTGEEFRILLNKLYPFIEVILITQNDTELKCDVVKKYPNLPLTSSLEYYKQRLSVAIDKSIERVCEARKLVDRMKTNNTVEQYLLEKIDNSINGVEKYDELKVSDVDKLVKAFRDLLQER